MGRSTRERPGSSSALRKRAHWTERVAREAVAELRASGEPLGRLAERKGITRQKLGYWVRRLESERSSPAFVEVATATAVARGATREAVALGATATRAEPVEIRIGAAVLRVGVSHDVEHVARLVEALARRVGDLAC